MGVEATETTMVAEATETTMVVEAIETSWCGRGITLTMKLRCLVDSTESAF